MSRLIPTYIEQALRIELLERAVIASEGDVKRLERELAEAKAEIVRLRELLEHAIGTDTPENNEQINLSPAELRAAGQSHCPLCYTFGNSHRKGCKYVNDRMDNHIQSKG